MVNSEELKERFRALKKELLILPKLVQVPHVIDAIRIYEIQLASILLELKERNEA